MEQYAREEDSMSTRTFTPAEIASIVEQFKAIKLNGEQVFTKVHQSQESERAPFYVDFESFGTYAGWLYFILDPSQD